MRRGSMNLAWRTRRSVYSAAKSLSVDGPHRFFVTGSTGFIGRRLVSRLVSDFGARSVTCLVKAPATAGEAQALDSQRACGVRIIAGDLRDDNVSAEPPPESSVLFHLAANIDTSASEADLRINDDGTERLLRWLAPRSSSPRIVYTSSVAVHDRQSRPVDRIREESPLVPRTEYGRSKLRGEAVVRACGEAGGCTWTILRLPTVYGPGQKPDGLFETLASLIARRAWAGRLDWPGRTSIIHVDDAVEVMIDLALRAETANRVFGVASDESLTVGEIARRIGERMGKPIAAIPLSPRIWRAAEWMVWNRTLVSLVPAAWRQTCWRLSLLVSDGFWMDTTKFRGVYVKPLREFTGAPECLRPAESA